MILIRRLTIGFLFLFWVAVSCHAEVIAGTVVGIVDGDTFQILTKDRLNPSVRIAGIDTPERRQAFGGEAKRMLSDIIFGRDVLVEWHKVDKYGRLVGKVGYKNVDVGLELIKQGLAWHYREYQNEQSPPDRAAYTAAELSARSRRIGLWSADSQSPPWEVRQSSRQKALLAPNPEDCFCGSSARCVGPRGGVFCIGLSGKKKYFRVEN